LFDEPPCGEGGKNRGIALLPHKVTEIIRYNAIPFLKNMIGKQGIALQP
jgi:hypothetical protein